MKMEGSLNCEMAKNMEVDQARAQSEEKKLELRLGLPGQDRPCKQATSVYFHGKTLVDERRQIKQPTFLHVPPPIPKETAQTLAFSPSANNGSQKRTAPPVVGWPPIRSSRRILASTSPPKTGSEMWGNKRDDSKGLFVKINMDGVPIGRKVDLNAYDSYEKLSAAVDQLFKGLLAAKKDSCNDGTEKHEEDASTKNVVNGSGEYTLVYEDNEGDRMLVGDVPWNMFVAAAKRLRVLKSSELPARTCEPNPASVLKSFSQADKMAI